MVNNYYTLVRSGVMPLWRVPTPFIDGVITLARDDVKYGIMSRETFTRITGMEYEPVQTQEVKAAIEAIQEPVKVVETEEDEAEKATTKRKRKKKADTDEEAETAKEDKED